jgi:hypothetical protein
VNFAGEVANIKKARAAGGHLEYRPFATIVSLAVVPAPASAQDFVAQLGGQRASYAIVGIAKGPLAAFIVDSSGKEIQSLGKVGPDSLIREAYFGVFRTDPIGPIWYQIAAGDCTSVWVAGTCIE